MDAHARLKMDAKKSLLANVEATDLITYIRELNSKKPNDKKLKQLFTDLYAEAIHSQLSDSENECMEEYRELLGNRSVRETIVNFLVSKAPAVISSKIRNPLPAINEESLRELDDELLSDRDELMDTILAKLDRITRLTETDWTEPMKTSFSEKTLITVPNVSPRSMRLLQQAFCNHPLYKWSKAIAKIKQDAEAESMKSSGDSQDYGDIDYTTNSEIKQTSIPTDYSDLQSAASVSVQCKDTSDEETKSGESGDLYATSDEEHCEHLNVDEPIPDETTRYYYDSPRYYFDKMFGTPPLPLRRPTVRCREPILHRPIKPASLRTPESSVTNFQSKRLQQQYPLARPAVPSRLFNRSQLTSQYRSPPQFKPSSEIRPPSQCEPNQSTSRYQSMPKYQSVAKLQSKPLPQKESFYMKHHFGKNLPVAEKPPYSARNIDLSRYNLESKPKNEQTYYDKTPQYDSRNNERFTCYGYNAYTLKEPVTPPSSEESHACSDTTTLFNTEGTTISEESITLLKSFLNTNFIQNKGSKRRTFLDILQQVYKY